MGNNRLSKIICPKCGAQYLPGEIYLPNAFLGQPRNVARDCTGKIVDYSGNSMDLKETYICDKCGCKFGVKAVVQFYTDVKETTNTVQPFRLPLRKDAKLIKADKLVLSEK